MAFNPGEMRHLASLEHITAAGDAFNAPLGAETWAKVRDIWGAFEVTSAAQGESEAQKITRQRGRFETYFASDINNKQSLVINSARWRIVEVALVGYQERLILEIERNG